MGFFSRFLGLGTSNDKQVTQNSICNFCGKEVTNDNEKIVLVSGDDKIQNFEKRIGLNLIGDAYRHDTDGQAMYYACGDCLKLANFCTKCSSFADNVTPITLRGERTGNETEEMLCHDCFKNILEGGGRMG